VLRVDSSASCEGDFRRRRDQLGKPTFSTTSTLELSGGPNGPSAWTIG